VLSVHTEWIDNGFHIWIAVREDDDQSRERVYDSEDSLLNDFGRDVCIEFHVLTIPVGKRVEDIISAPDVVFRRTA
jgi:hypothetical protein